VSADWLWLGEPAGRIQPLLKLPASRALERPRSIRAGAVGQITGWVYRLADSAADDDSCCAAARAGVREMSHA
jgi:hypothetical protein